MLPAAEDPAVAAWFDELGLRVESSSRLAGGLTSTVERLDVVDDPGGRRRVVLRRSPPMPHLPTFDPAVEVAADVDVLRRRAGDALTPDLIAADPTGERCGVPAVVLQLLPGAPVTAPADVGSWLDCFVDAVRSVRAHPTPTDGLRPLEHWCDPDRPPPAWSAVPEAWDEAARRCRAGLPGGPTGLVHRDLHPGNVVLATDSVGVQGLSGVVDWSNATTAPIDVDVSRMRVEIALLAGTDVADAFLRRCCHAGLVEDYDRGWDGFVALEVARPVERIAAAFGGLGSSRSAADMRAVLDELVERAACGAVSP